jgi:hypothetical protein
LCSPYRDKKVVGVFVRFSCALHERTSTIEEEVENPFGPAAGEQIRLWTYLREKHS